MRKTISITFIFLGTFGLCYAANTGEYLWCLLCSGLLILGALVLKKSKGK